MNKKESILAGIFCNIAAFLIAFGGIVYYSFSPFSKFCLMIISACLLSMSIYCYWQGYK